METLLVYKDGKTNKYWKSSVLAYSLTVEYGKIGSTGSVKVKTFDSEEECEKAAAKLIRSKIKKGYVPAAATHSMMKASTMTEEQFWNLLKTAKTKSNEVEGQAEWLICYLASRPIKDIIMFDFLFQKAYVKSYTSNLWAAAHIVMGGCTDDTFDYFRAWLLYLGKEAYEAAIKQPETILPHLQPLEEAGGMPEFELLLSLASVAYEEKTGLGDQNYVNLYVQWAPGFDEEPELEFDWTEDDGEKLRSRFPLLWDRYANKPLGY